MGIDPGYALMGWGVVESEGSRMKLINYGCVETKAGVPMHKPRDSTKAHAISAQRLRISLVANISCSPLQLLPYTARPTRMWHKPFEGGFCEPQPLMVDPNGCYAQAIRGQ